MKFLALIAAAAALLSPGVAACGQPLQGGPRAGDTYAITIDKQTEQNNNRGGKGSSHDQDGLLERVIRLSPAGQELEYDLPKGVDAATRRAQWQFPVRVLRSPGGDLQLRNAAELEARLGAWLKAAGLSRADCGHWVFTWNAFQIECDPESVLTMLNRVDLDRVDLHAGASYRDPDAASSAALQEKVSDAASLTFVAQMTVDPEAVRRQRAETDVVVAQLSKQDLTPEAALRARAKDTVSGTISVTFEAGEDRKVRRRTRVMRLEIRRPDGRQENETVTEVVDRKLVSRGR